MIDSFNWKLFGKEKTKHKRKIITVKEYAKIRKELAERKVYEILLNAHDMQSGYNQWKSKIDEIREKKKKQS